MACVLTSTLSLDCLDQVGGIDTIYIATKDDIASMTVDTSGQVTAITMDSGKKFYEYKVHKEKSNLTEAFTSSDSGGFYTQTLVAPFMGLSYQKRYQFKLMAANLLTIIAKDNNGNYLLIGYTGARVTGNEKVTGTALGDPSQQTVTFTSNEKDSVYFVESSVISGIIEAAA